jgi:hypothetical protein
MKKKMMEKNEFVEILKKNLFPRGLLFNLLALLLVCLLETSVCLGLLSIGWTESVLSWVAIGLTMVLIPGLVLILERLQRVDPQRKKPPFLPLNKTHH